MLRKKSIYRKELDSYICISQFCARLDWVNNLHIWCKDSMTSLLNQVFAKSD